MPRPPDRPAAADAPARTATDFPAEAPLGPGAARPAEAPEGAEAPGAARPTEAPQGAEAPGAAGPRDAPQGAEGPGGPLVIVQFGLRYSPNVGDGIIAECLAHALQALAPGTRVRMVDLSGRTGWGAPTLRHRRLALRLLGALPARLRAGLVEARLARMLDRVEPAWRAAARGADLAVIGGGQLLSDADLNFPVKLSRAAAVLRAEGTPTAVYATGAARNWSPRGAALLCDLLATDLRLVGMRDAPSAAAWAAQMPPGAPAAILTRDPGLLAADCYGRPGSAEGRRAADRAGRNRPGAKDGDGARADGAQARHGGPEAPARIGICITDPAVLRYHADRGAKAARPAGARLYEALALELCAGGEPVALFCNGAAEDAAALRRLAARPAVRRLVESGAATVLPVPDRPATLAHQIAGLRALVAHRLHACIVGYSYGLPVVGLGWDGKVAAFFEAIEAPGWFLPPDAVTPAAIRDRLARALAEGVAPQVHAGLTREAWEGVERLIALARSARRQAEPGPAARAIGASAPAAGGPAPAPTPRPTLDPTPRPAPGPARGAPLAPDAGPDAAPDAAAEAPSAALPPVSDPVSAPVSDPASAPASAPVPAPVPKAEARAAARPARR